MKEQTKPETAQEAAERTCNEKELQLGGAYHHKKAFVEGANWQFNQLYTAEDCAKMLEALRQRCAEEAAQSCEDHLFGVDAYNNVEAIKVHQFIPPIK